MKNLGFSAVMALLMMFGCAKDEVITTEQESFSVEKNGQPVIYGEKGPTKDNAGVGTGIWFKGTSSVDSPSLPIYFSSESAEMQILSEGNFNGRLIGYGKINEIDSKYVITIESQEDKIPFQPLVDCWGQYIYNLEISGIVYITDRDSSFFSFTLTGKFHTSHDFSYSNLIYKGMSGQEGIIGKITDGQNKFSSWKDKPLNGSVWCDNLETGIINLNIQ
ncbi:MAG: hypothetical protein ACYC01_12960 [Lutibacter sp.]